MQYERMFHHDDMNTFYLRCVNIFSTIYNKTWNVGIWEWWKQIHSS